MQNKKIRVDEGVLDKITSSNKMSDSEKISFMKYVWYMTPSEKKELTQII